MNIEDKELAATYAKIAQTYNMDTVALRYIEVLQEIDKWSQSKTDLCIDMDNSFREKMEVIITGLIEQSAKNEKIFELAKTLKFNEPEKAFLLYGLGVLYEDSNVPAIRMSVIAAGYELNKKYNLLSANE